MNIKVFENCLAASHEARHPNLPNTWISAAEISVESYTWDDYDGEHREFIKVRIGNVTVEFNEFEFKGTYGTLRLKNTFIGIFK